ncbi:hypothetical protein QN362_10100 [Actimicrobium sp. CCC2.4]|uniref:hypothetical protein n=1 Tax=Actimicrobium sp. CCC2.4 TaxID=3048606 RepID=UPI002AC95A77|nr:hypothetical protein [Actimicrobium sp. CCC2.4]MEB0135678.1 hypothetical protein [Actimicrobium sp. CCC2.4]WPX33763.1 hypothetical protein RHM62_08070 [Actimicrobium sp. CCC2.4]
MPTALLRHREIIVLLNKPGAFPKFLGININLRYYKRTIFWNNPTQGITATTVSPKVDHSAVAIRSGAGV